MRRAARLAVLYILEALAALLALCILAGGALLWRLAEGPLDAEILREPVTGALTAAVSGDVTSINSLQVRFDPNAAALVLIADGVQIADAAGGAIVSARPPSCRACEAGRLRGGRRCVLSHPYI